MRFVSALKPSAEPPAAAWLPRSAALLRLAPVLLRQYAHCTLRQGSFPALTIRVTSRLTGI